MDFAQKLKCYRTMLNLTQNDIADAMGVDRSTYSGYETGKSLPTSDGIGILSALFGVSPATLMDEKPIPPPKRFKVGYLCDSAPEILFGKKEKQEIDMNFPELTEDEKELLAKYRAMKSAEALLSKTSLTPKDDIIRRFLLLHY